jgi:hypothetical protein
MDLRFFIGQILVATLTSPYSPHGGVLTLKVENADTSRYIQYLIPTIYDIFTLVFHHHQEKLSDTFHYNSFSNDSQNNSSSDQSYLSIDSMFVNLLTS